MKLTDEDKSILKEWGFAEADIKQIENALKKCNTKYKFRGQRITRETAISLLGRKVFLSGISRSAFHFSASRETSSGEFVYFDSSAFFKQGGQA